MSKLRTILEKSKFIAFMDDLEKPYGGPKRHVGNTASTQNTRMIIEVDIGSGIREVDA